MPTHEALTELANGPREPLIGFASSHRQTALRAVSWGGMLLAWSIIGGALILWIAVDMAIRATGFAAPSPVLGWVLGVLVLSWVVLRWDIRWPRPRPSAYRIGPVSPDSSRRVWCVLQRHQLSRLEHEGPIDDVAFEPEVFAAPYAARPTRGMYWAWVAAAAGVFAAVFVAMRAVPGFPVPPINILVIYGTLALSWLIVAAAWPTTIRIVPGRLDIMRGWFLSSRRPVIATINLRDTRVVLDLRSGVLFANGPAKDLQSDAAVALGPAKFRIAHAILRAAVSTAEPPPLPDAEAVG